MLGNAELFCQNCPVTLRLGQQDHKIRVVQNILDFRAGQQVLDVLRQRAGHTAPFAEHLPDGNKIAGGELIPEQNMELVKVAPSRDAALIVGIDRGIDKLICDVHRNFSEIVSHALEHDAHHTAVGFDIRGMVEQVKGACTVELQGRRHAPGLRLRLFQKFLVQVLEQGHPAVPHAQGQIPVDQPHTAVYDGFLNRL